MTINTRIPLLKAANLVAGYGPGTKKKIPVAGPLSVEICAGQLICLLGPNGSGKSTLLRTLAGLQNPLEGSLEIDGKEILALHPAQLAQKISLVLTDPLGSGNLNVYTLVALGRYPYSNWLGIVSETDKARIAWAIEATQIEAFLDRKIGTLSDGELQKVMLARALAQDTPLLMLDEPTAHLDLPSRIQLLRRLHRLARETRKGILLTTHELDLALQVADEVWLLQTGTNNSIAQLRRGSPEDLVLNGIFEAAFEKEGIRFERSTGNFQMHEDKGRFITIIGEGAPAFWTQRAVRRRGFTVTDLGLTGQTIRVREDKGRPLWILEELGGSREYHTMADLLEALDTA